MLGKSSGLTLRVAAVMHVAFHLKSPHDIPKQISQQALEAALDFVDVCCKHAAFMAGREEMVDLIQQLQTGKYIVYIGSKFCTGSIVNKFDFVLQK